MSYALRGVQGAVLHTIGTINNPPFGQATAVGSLATAQLASTDSSTTDPYSCSTPGWVEVVTAGGPYAWASIWCKPSCAAGETTPTFNSASGPANFYAMLSEFTGAPQSTPVDSTGVSGTSGQNPTATNAAPDLVGGDLVLANAFWNGSNAMTAGCALTDSNSGALAPVAVTNGISLTITAATNSGTTITATVPSTAGLVSGGSIIVTGAGGTWGSINGSWVITSVVNATQITFNVGTAPTGSYTASSASFSSSQVYDFLYAITTQTGLTKDSAAFTASTLNGGTACIASFKPAGPATTSVQLQSPRTFYVPGIGTGTEVSGGGTDTGMFFNFG